MTLIACPDCGAEISDRASTCPRCGAPQTPSSERVDVARRATVFADPRTGTRVDIANAGLYTFLIGPIYFCLHRVWTHAIVSLALALLTFGLSWFVYPFFAQGILRTHLLREGMRPVGTSAPPTIDRRADKWIWSLLAASVAAIALLAYIHR